MDAEKVRHIAFCVNEAYVQYILVTIRSIIANNDASHVHIHVLTDHLSAKTRRLLDSMSTEDINITVHEVDDTPLRGLQTRIYTLYAWYRVLLPEILSDIDRVLYLDADTAVTGDISYLFDIDMDNIAIAAVEDDWVDTMEAARIDGLGIKNRYRMICSGVLVMNLDYWRRHDLTRRIIDFAVRHHDNLVCPDQDSINSVCQDMLTLLPLKFGVTSHMFENDRFVTSRGDELAECLTDPRIAHYCMLNAWFYQCRHPLVHLWHRYNKMLGRKQAAMKHRYPESRWRLLRSSLWYWLHKDVYVLNYKKYCKRFVNDGNS